MSSALEVGVAGLVVLFLLLVNRGQAQGEALVRGIGVLGRLEILHGVGGPVLLHEEVRQLEVEDLVAGIIARDLFIILDGFRAVAAGFLHLTQLVLDVVLIRGDFQQALAVLDGLRRGLIHHPDEIREQALILGIFRQLHFQLGNQLGLLERRAVIFDEKGNRIVGTGILREVKLVLGSRLRPLAGLDQSMDVLVPVRFVFTHAGHFREIPDGVRVVLLFVEGEGHQARGQRRQNLQLAELLGGQGEIPLVIIQDAFGFNQTRILNAARGAAILDFREQRQRVERARLLGQHGVHVLLELASGGIAFVAFGSDESHAVGARLGALGRFLARFAGSFRPRLALGVQIGILDRPPQEPGVGAALETALGAALCDGMRSGVLLGRRAGVQGRVLKMGRGRLRFDGGNGSRNVLAGADVLHGLLKRRPFIGVARIKNGLLVRVLRGNAIAAAFQGLRQLLPVFHGFRIVLQHVPEHRHGLRVFSRQQVKAREFDIEGGIRIGSLAQIFQQPRVFLRVFGGSDCFENREVFASQRRIGRIQLKQRAQHRHLGFLHAGPIQRGLVPLQDGGIVGLKGVGVLVGVHGLVEIAKFDVARAQQGQGVDIVLLRGHGLLQRNDGLVHVSALVLLLRRLEKLLRRAGEGRRMKQDSKSHARRYQGAERAKERKGEGAGLHRSLHFVTIHDKKMKEHGFPHDKHSRKALYGFVTPKPVFPLGREIYKLGALKLPVLRLNPL